LHGKVATLITQGGLSFYFVDVAWQK